MDIIRHMRRSAFYAGRPGGLITEITWKAGNLEVICLHGGLRFPYIGRMAKNFRLILGFFHCIYAFRSILYAFRSPHPKITENLPIN